MRRYYRRRFDWDCLGRLWSETPRNSACDRGFAHISQQRVRGHIAICVLAAVIEAVIANQLADADIADADIDNQIITPRWAPAELNRIRVHHLTAGDRNIRVTTKRNALQAQILAALVSDPARRRIGVSDGDPQMDGSPAPRQAPQPDLDTERIRCGRRCGVGIVPCVPDAGAASQHNGVVAMGQ